MIWSLIHSSSNIQWGTKTNQNQIARKIWWVWSFEKEYFNILNANTFFKKRGNRKCAWKSFFFHQSRLDSFMAKTNMKSQQSTSTIHTKKDQTGLEEFWYIPSFEIKAGKKHIFSNNLTLKVMTLQSIKVWFSKVSLYLINWRSSSNSSIRINSKLLLKDKNFTFIIRVLLLLPMYCYMIGNTKPQEQYKVNHIGQANHRAGMLVELSGSHAIFLQ